MDIKNDPPVKKWLVVFLVYSDFRAKDHFAVNKKMKVELDAMFKDIIRNQISENCRLYVLMNSIVPFQNQQEGIKTADQTALITIAPSTEGPFNKIDHIELFSHETTDFDDIPLGSLTKTEKLNHYLSFVKPVDEEEVLLITWDHGAGFGIFESELGHISVDMVEPIGSNPKAHKYLNLFLEKIDSKFNSLGKQHFENQQDLVSEGEAIFWVGPNPYKLEPHPEERFFKKYADSINKFNLTVAQEKFALSVPQDFSLNSSFSGIEEKFTEPELNSFLESTNLHQVSFPLSGIEVSDILLNSELADIILNWIGPVKKVAILLMMNCSMMNLHTMYAMKDRVKCLVAPQGSIDNPGYNYKAILREISSPGAELTIKYLARFCVSSAHSPEALRRAERLNKKESELVNVIRRWVLFAVDLEALNSEGKPFLTESVNSITEIIKHYLDLLSNKDNVEFMHQLKYARSFQFDFAKSEQHSMIDVVNWLINIININSLLGPDPLVDIRTTAIRALSNSLPFNNNNFVLANFFENEHFNTNVEMSTTKPPTSFSIFFPQSKVEEPTISNFRNDLLMKELSDSWKALLRMIYPNNGLD